MKELYKLENGKYVAPAPLEEKLQLSPYIAQCVIYGDNKPHNVALIVPDMAALKEWAKAQGIDADGEELLSHAQRAQPARKRSRELQQGLQGLRAAEGRS